MKQKRDMRAIEKDIKQTVNKLFSGLIEGAIKIRENKECLEKLYVEKKCRTQLTKNSQ